MPQFVAGILQMSVFGSDGARKYLPHATSLICSNTHIDLAQTDQDAAAARAPSSAVALGVRVFNHPSATTVACRAVTKVLADRFAYNFSTGLKDPRRDSSVRIRDEAADELRTHQHWHLGDADHVLEDDSLARKKAIVGLGVFDAT